MKVSIVLAVVFAALTSTSALAAQVQAKDGAPLCSKMFTKDGLPRAQNLGHSASSSGSAESAKEIRKQ